MFVSLAYTAQPREDAGGPSYFWGRATCAEHRFYRLCFLERDRDLILGEYLPHVRREGRAVMVQNRQRKLFTNISGDIWDSDGLVAHYRLLAPLAIVTADHPAPASGPAAARGGTWCSSTPRRSPRSPWTR